ncbi:asparagine synthase (glutamine-hydrolyzing) [Desulfohalobiaceae bacterium Ax17]|uniref:asparagine synthase (glutamine-hydrolyzing) n=1 Tax=Desulfovulcanus ferrireducens TaxID=2831190 RepID=UPI00207BC423|nr:asparagine synthase (glutamine-hydrolyzing) [Desulfovulcanus ferrireducens]MBT8763041.1 asparagine synthase (glutamine-hydrolyzing) [Desulfovulcanus ferrireducens]
MCGIAGFIDFACSQNRFSLESTVRRMADTLTHRGPDAGGVWVDEQRSVALGHRRLAIIDLLPSGNQPMLSPGGRYIIVFNGEIYNFQQLRQELAGRNIEWRGNSDTEVMLAAFEVLGVERAIKKFIGMFAFALWDRQKRCLYLVRDRLGIKPLYYGWAGKTFLFASELKALRAYPGWSAEINRNALSLFLRHNYIPTPYSIYEGVFKLQPGTILTISFDSIPGSLPEPDVYWSAKEVTEEGVRKQFALSEEDLVEQLDLLLKDAIGLRMIADVPLGAFLSGGIDSSTVVALMQTQSHKPVKTFTIGFEEEGFNEAVQAKAVADYLKTDHTELYVTPNQAMAVIPKLPTLYDEPFADSSQIPTYLVSELTRQHVTVSLSGDGGDELFGGYNRYFWGRSIWQKIGWVPGGLRNLLSGGLTLLSPQAWDNLFMKLEPILPGKVGQRFPGDKLHKLAEILAVENPEAMYRGLVSHWKKPATIVSGAVEPLTVLTDSKRWANLPDFTLRMMFLDLVSYLPDDILVKVDRASMGVSLEARVPFLDHRVVEFAWRVPLSLKVKNGQGKWILRRVLYKYLPKELVERPKMGFGVPLADWLRGPLRDWAESLLNEARLKQEGFFNPAPIRQKWHEHLSGKRNWQYYLWDILMFQAWLERWG